MVPVGYGWWEEGWEVFVEQGSDLWELKNIKSDFLKSFCF